MAKPLPRDPFLSGCWEPWPMEGRIRDAQVSQGEIPRALRGTLYRNSANQRFAPIGPYHPFDGDGMVHAFRFEDGRVDYCNRWVRTEKFLLEEQHGEALFGGLANIAQSDPRAEGTPFHLANTSVVHHAGKLLALWEAGAPFSLDPVTLETEGRFTFDGELGRGGARTSFTAHPRFDPVSGEMLAFSYSMVAPWCVYHEIDAEGRMVRSEQIPVPYPAMMHDFVATRRFAIFPVLPATFRGERIAETGSPMGWEPDLPARFGLMPRQGGPEDMRWFDVDTCFVFHFMNAWDDGEDAVVVEGARFPRLPMAAQTGNAEQKNEPARLWRFRFDLRSGAVREGPLSEIPGDFLQVDPRVSCQRHRHGWAATQGWLGDGNEGFGGLVHYDHELGTETVLGLERGDTTSEALFVPDPKRGTDAGNEGDGYLMTVMHRGAERRSDLLILDALDLCGEPVATIALPHRVPMGFHGSWVPAAD